MHSKQENNWEGPKPSTCVLNARSVRGKKLERAAYICDYVVENQFDCVGITETWLSSVAFMHKEHYKVKVDKASSFETMTVMLDAASYTFRFVTIYRIPLSNNNKLKTSLFVEELSDYIEHAATLSGKLILIGDFNVHWDCEEDSERMELATLLNDYDFVQHVKGPTPERGHTLDLVITRQEDDLVASCDIGAFISDHNSLNAILNCSKTHSPRKKTSHIAV